MPTTPTDPQAWRPSDLELGRRAFRERQTARSVLIAAASTILLAAVVWVSIINTPGWARVQMTFFDPAVALEALPRVWGGFLLNLQVLFFAVIAVAILASFIAFVRTLRGPIWFPVRALAAGYTDLFRGIPLIIVLYLVGFGIPALQGPQGARIPAVLLGTIAVVLVYSAYVSEVIRAGIEAVHPSQRLAARSLGLSHGRTMRLVVLPQAIRKVSPALMNDFIAMQKDVGLISIVGIVDAVRAAQIETATSFNYTPYIVAAVLFVLLALPMIRFTDWWTARMRQREQVGGIV